VIPTADHRVPSHLVMASLIWLKNIPEHVSFEHSTHSSFQKVHVHVWAHACVYAHMHARTHTNTHTHTHYLKILENQQAFYMSQNPEATAQR